MKTSFEVILKPILTEKLTAQEEPLQRYGFMVDRTANKIQIKKAIEEMYGVTVASVNTMRYAGKNKSRFTKAGVIAGKSNAYKKAMITVKKGDKIDFYSNI
ncbi:MAG: 50S ribosomal protein L23 [Bacteroidales bacterium]|jgi:large subunit ribosomal protein L23|nr:50S ribosomal protein L23 [Bacteroidales bacterium]